MTVADLELRGHRALWQVAAPIPSELRAALNGESVMLAHLLYCRGYRSLSEIQAFLRGDLISHDPFLLPDMEAAVERIARAADQSERVAVYGDFDCDGITSTAAIVETLTGLGLSPIAYIPTREEGHGLHPEALARLADRNVFLLVTADCGITCLEEVQVAKGMGMDVIVTDHHEARADGSLPTCPTISPTRHDSLYPFRSLSGAGVAYKLAQALRARLPQAPNPDDLLDLIALGTIADVVPLRDENRALVIRGMSRLRDTRRPGLLALYEVAGVDRHRIDPVSVGFYLAPRINAANRMASPQLAYDLVTAIDGAVAAGLAERLSDFNQQRQALVAETFDSMAATLGEPERIASDVSAGTQPPVLVVVGEWPSGISGLLASKLVELYGLPAFVGSVAGDGIVSVSARGVAGVHIDEMLEACEAAFPGGLFLGYGGHARAGGFRVAQDKLAVAQQTLEEYARGTIAVDPKGSILTIDAEVRFAQLTAGAGRQLLSLAPFGMDFGEPLFLTRKVELKRIVRLKSGSHGRLSLMQGTTRLEGVLFNAPPAVFQLQPGTHLDVVFHFGLNEWNGQVRPEITLRDWRVSA
ncbi:MAG TPA: single-stranded-DNA-specific exonuclease RecJ [Chloroflexota bacterium]